MRRVATVALTSVEDEELLASSRANFVVLQYAAANTLRWGHIFVTC